MEKKDGEINLDLVRKEITNYLSTQLKNRKISQDIYEKGRLNIIRNIEIWSQDETIDKISPNFKLGLYDAIVQKRWADICDFYIDDISFGTAGIRGLAVRRAFDVPNKNDELVRLFNEGLDARVLKGPNSINNVVLLLKSAGLAQYAFAKKFSSIIIGYDSRIHGREFAELVTRLFIAYNLKVYLFDDACPYPELMLASSHLNTDLGVYISASHNDKRYNGYKVCRYGEQLDSIERNEIYNDYIKDAKFSDIKLAELEDAPADKLIFLGGEGRVKGVNYYSTKCRRELMNIHKVHIAHCEKFISDPQMLKEYAGKINIGYCAFYGAGKNKVPRLLMDSGFHNLRLVSSMHVLNGFFPKFSELQQPDPGDDNAMNIANTEYILENGKESFDALDIFIGTDPDADRMGIMVKVPESQVKVYGKNFVLLTADEAWLMLLWYRINYDLRHNNTKEMHKKFIALSHVTSESLILLAQKYDIGYVRTFVGFSMLVSAVSKVWNNEDLSKYPKIILDYNTLKGRDINVLACEQSNGFSILGSKPKLRSSLGIGGHVKDKDGTMAALLLCEVAAYAKSQGKTIIELMDENIYLDREIGLFENYYESSPRYGQYEGLEGMSKKINILKKVEEFSKLTEERYMGDLRISKVEIYKTGKYDALHNWEGFPDEGIRFFFNDQYNYLTIRPSGTSQSLRIHVQVRDDTVTTDDIIEKKIILKNLARSIVAEARKKFGITE